MTMMNSQLDALDAILRVLYEEDFTLRELVNTKDSDAKIVEDGADQEHQKKKGGTNRSQSDIPYWSIEVGHDGVPYIGFVTLDDWLRGADPYGNVKSTYRKGTEEETAGEVRKTNKDDDGTKEEIPDHYNLSVPPVDYINSNNLDFFEGNVIKYVTRHRKKNGAEDIKKAIHYLKMILKYEYGEE